MYSSKLKISTIAAFTACFVVSAGAATTPSVAQVKKEERVPVSNEPGATTATYGNWVLQCVRLTNASATNDAAEGKSCEVVQSIQVQGQAQPIAQIALGRLPKETKMQMTVVLPVNISPSKNVHMSGNGKTGAEEKAGVDLPWVRCIQSACLASAEPSAEFLATIRGVPEGKIRFVDAGGQSVELPISWNGINQALNALDKAS